MLPPISVIFGLFCCVAKGNTNIRSVNKLVILFNERFVNGC